jgi:hypothetical protein
MITYTFYGPPDHQYDAILSTKEEAIEIDEEFYGKTSE